MGRTRLRNRYIDESSHTDPCRLPQSQPQRKVAVFQSKILPQYQNSLFAHFAPAGILLGSAFPKPCLCGLRRLKIPQNIFSDFSKTVPLLADEPTGNLDSQNSSEVIALLKETSKKYEQTIIMITHNRSIAQTADRVLQVSDGTLTDFGRCRE